MSESETDSIKRKNAGECLALFNRKAKILEDKGFSKSVRSEGLSTKTILSSGKSLSTNLPSQDLIDSTVVTLRMFFQNNDPISFSNIEELIEQDSCLSDAFKEQFRKQREYLNHYLDGYPKVNIVDEEKPKPGYSNREIFDVFVYGEIAHSTKSKREKYQTWKNSGSSFPAVQHAFAEVLNHVVNIITYTSKFIEIELNKDV